MSTKKRQRLIPLLVGLLAIFLLTGAVYPKGRYIITTPESLGAPIGSQTIECVWEEGCLVCTDRFGAYEVRPGEKILARGIAQPNSIDNGSHVWELGVARMEIVRGKAKIIPLVPGLTIKARRH